MHVKWTWLEKQPSMLPSSVQRWPFPRPHPLPVSRHVVSHARQCSSYINLKDIDNGMLYISHCYGVTKEQSAWHPPQQWQHTLHTLLNSGSIHFTQNFEDKTRLGPSLALEQRLSTSWWIQTEGYKLRYPKGRCRTCYQECGCHLIIIVMKYSFSDWLLAGLIKTDKV